MHVKDPVYDKIQEFENTLKEKKAKAQEIRDKRIKGEAKVEQLKKNEQEFLAKIKAAGLDPDELKAYIIDRQKKLSAVLAKLDQILPDENGKVEIMAGVKEDVNAIDRIDVVSGDFKIPEDVELPSIEVPDEKPAEPANKEQAETGDDLFAELEKSDSNMPF